MAHKKDSAIRYGAGDVGRRIAGICDMLDDGSGMKMDPVIVQSFLAIAGKKTTLDSIRAGIHDWNNINRNLALIEDKLDDLLAHANNGKEEA